MVFYAFHVDFGGINLGLVCLVVNVLVVVAVHAMLHGRPVKQYAVS
jgi:SSS family solute:Na+ symporter